MKLFIILTILSTLQFSEQGLNSYYRENVPRFKHVHNERHEVYLGDAIVLDCQTYQTKVATSVEWFRNNNVMKDEDIDIGRIRKDNVKMQLHLSHIDVSDQGLWGCRVSNGYGQIARNFTVEVIDFCDFFLIPEIPQSQIPMECVCLWRYIKEAKRADVDYRAANYANCAKYTTRMIARARKPLENIPCFDDNCNTTEAAERTFFSKDEAHVKRVQLKKDGTLHEISNDVPIARTEYINAGYEDDENEDDYQQGKSVSPDESLTELNVTAEEPPHFKTPDNSVQNETYALPAGRTLKLNCRPDGYPEPRVVWFKNGIMLNKDSPRSGGYAYKVNKWSVEVEDALETDSGDYHCEAFNRVGSTKKHFKVIIVNRMRRPPIIVPNILKNQSVNVNSTATFHCKVVSDLLPHIMWVRINKVNGSFSYYNASAKEYMFNYTEMDTFDKAHVHHVGDESALTIFNVSLSDQGVYACLSGNSLGTTMANATLTVNEFMAIHLLTGDEPKPNNWSAPAMFFTTLLTILLIMATLFGIYVLLYKLNIHNKGLLEETVGLVAKKKRVVVSKRTEDDNNSDDGLSPYQIQIIETPITKKEAAKKQRKRLSSENTVLSEYEVDCDPKWEIDRSKLSLVHMLGEGAFGEVWKATLRESANDEVSVAVKKLKMSAHEKELIDLVSEMETFKVIGQHDNVLRLIGCCTGSGPLYVVVELCKYGNLRDFLRSHRPKEERVKKSSQELADYMEPRKQTGKDDIELIPNLTQRHLVQFAWQVAQGMQFLANKKIIHRDLAARNVLVGDGHILKISDFGLSRNVNFNDYYRKRGNGRLPIKWMALEALDSHVYTIESDVWSYGVLLWEIMTLGGTPYPTIAMPELYANLKEGYRMEPPHLCPEEVYDLMCSCWREKMEARPSFETIVLYLEWMLSPQTNDYISQSQEFPSIQVNYFRERSTASGPVSPLCEELRKRRPRPLSAPVNLPWGTQHTICDDSNPNLIVNETDADHMYCNDNVLEDHIMTPETSQLYIHKAADGNFGNGYVRQDRLVRGVSGVANQSLDSALGSPAWPSYSNHKASCLDSNHQYYNTSSKIQYLCFTFDETDDMTRSRDSAIFEESYHPNYIQPHPLYSKIIFKKNMTPRNSLPTKETIV